MPEIKTTPPLTSTPLQGEVLDNGDADLKRVALPIRLVVAGRPVYVDTPRQLLAVTRLISEEADGNRTARALTHRELQQLNAPFKLALDAPVPGGELVVPANLELVPPEAPPTPGPSLPDGDVDKPDERRLPSWLKPGSTSTRFLEVPIQHDGSTTTLWMSPATLRGRASDYQTSRLGAHLGLLPSHPREGSVNLGLREADVPRLRALIGLGPNGEVPPGGPTGAGRHAEWFRSILAGLERRDPAGVRALSLESERSAIALDAALAYRLTGDPQYRELAVAALESASEPMQLDDSSFLADLASRANNSDPHWGPYVSATRYLQKHALAYNLLRPSLDDNEARRCRRRIVQMAKVWHETTPFRYMNNHVARHGAALGTCALALWDEPSLRQQTREWLAMADYGVGLGLNPIGPDGISGEGSVYASYGDQTVLTYLRQVWEATGDCPALRHPRVRAYLRFMAEFYQPKLGWQSWDDGNSGPNTFLPLLMAPGIPEAPLIKAKLGDELPVPGEAYAEAIMFADPFDQVVPSTAAELDRQNLFYEDGGIAVFRSAGAGDRPSWRLALLGEHRHSQGHEKSNRGTFLVAVEDASGTDAVTYVPGGTKDVSYAEGALPPASNAPANEMGGPYGELQDPMLGSFDAHGLAASGVRTVTDDLLQSRQLLWVRDGQYGLMVDWAESDEPRRVGFRFHGSGEALPDGAFRLPNGTFLRFDPVADSSPWQIDPLGHHSAYHGHEARHPILQREVTGERTSLLTVVSSDRGRQLETRPLVENGVECGAAIVAEDGTGEDWILRAPPSGELAYEDVAFKGVGALIAGTTAEPPQSISLFHGREIKVGEHRFATSVEADLFFKLSPDTDGQGIQGQVVGPEGPWQLTVAPGFVVNSALFNGRAITPSRQADGSYVFELQGSGRLSFGAGATVPDLVDGPEPLEGAPGQLDARPLRERSTLEYLGSFRDQESFERALHELTPAEQQRLTYEIIATVGPAAYDAVIDRLAGFFGIPAGDFDALVGALALFGGQGGAFPIAIGAENVTDDGGRVLGGSVTGNVMRDQKVTRVHVYGRWQDGTHASVEYNDPTDSGGGLWAPNGTGLDTGSSVTVRAGGEVGGATIDGVASHATTDDFSETGLGVSVTGGDASGTATARLRDGDVASGSGSVRVGNTSLHGNADANTTEVGVRHGPVGATYRRDGDTESVTGNASFQPTESTFAHVAGGVSCAEDGTYRYEGNVTLAGEQWFVRGGFVEGGAAGVGVGVRTEVGDVSATAHSEEGRVIWSGSLTSGGKSVTVKFDQDQLRQIGLACRQQIMGAQTQLRASLELAPGQDPLVGVSGMATIVGDGDSGTVNAGLSLATRDFTTIERFLLELQIVL